MANENQDGLKSAFDLAMERMAQRGESMARLTGEQKQALADVASQTKAKIAEIEIMFGKKLESAKATGDAEKLAKVEDEMRQDIRKAKEKDEAERRKIRG